MRWHGKDLRSSLLISVTAVTLMTRQLLHREQKGRVKMQLGSRDVNHAPVEMQMCVQLGDQTEFQRFTLLALRDWCFSKLETGKELPKRAKRVPEIKSVQQLLLLVFLCIQSSPVLRDCFLWAM